jgi:hypothetical protein
MRAPGLDIRTAWSDPRVMYQGCTSLVFDRCENTPLRRIVKSAEFVDDEQVSRAYRRQIRLAAISSRFLGRPQTLSRLTL